MGTGAQAIGASSISIGTGNIVNGNNSGAIGDPSIIDGSSSYSVGNNNTIGTGADNTFVMGNNVNIGNGVAGAVSLGNASSVTQAGGVALGQNSVANRAGMNGQAEQFSGVSVASTQAAVSVGAAGGERQITNVAGGTQATDAVNVRQLQAVQTQSTQYTDANFNHLDRRIDRVATKAYSGVAAAIAMEAAP
jgi:autotransporter adhesin